MNGIYCEQDYQKCRVGHVPMYRTEWLDMYPCTVLYGWTCTLVPYCMAGHESLYRTVWLDSGHVSLYRTVWLDMYPCTVL